MVPKIGNSHSLIRPQMSVVYDSSFGCGQHTEKDKTDGEILVLVFLNTTLPPKKENCDNVIRMEQPSFRISMFLSKQLTTGTVCFVFLL